MCDPRDPTLEVELMNKCAQCGEPCEKLFCCTTCKEEYIADNFEE